MATKTTAEYSLAHLNCDINFLKCARDKNIKRAADFLYDGDEQRAGYCAGVADGLQVAIDLLALNFLHD